MNAVTSYNPPAGFDREVGSMCRAYGDLRDALSGKNPQQIRRALVAAAKVNIDQLGANFQPAQEPASHNDIVAAIAHILAVTKCAGGIQQEVFLDTLIDEIKREGPSRGVLATAKRKVLHTSEFIPSIAAVMTALKEAASEYRSAAYRLENFSERIAEAEDVLNHIRGD